MAGSSRTIVFFPEGAYGPTNNCVGIGHVLRQRGHRVVFIVEESFAGRLEAQGFEERLMRLGPKPETEEVPGQFWIDFIRDTAPIFRKPTIEQLGEFMQPTWQALIDGAKYVDDRLREIIDELAPGRDRRGQRRRVPGPARVRPAVGPDRVLQSGRDQGSGDPAVLLRLPGRGPIGVAGVPRGDRANPPGDVGRLRCASAGSAARPGLTWSASGPDFIHESPWLNLYLYPAEADYQRERPLAPTWHRLDSCVRASDGTWELPEHLRGGEGALIYLSLGSLGSADVGLMQRLVDVMADDAPSGHRQQGAAWRTRSSLPDAMAGERLPAAAGDPAPGRSRRDARWQQHRHRGFHAGKPMVVLPLFWDQVDNAQRVDETGFGVRLATYDFEDGQLTGAIDRLLADGPLRARMAAASARMRANPGTVAAADRIEQVARTGQPVPQ